MFGPNIPTNLYGPLLAGVYTTPAIYCEVKVVFTNAVPTDAYRGAGCAIAKPARHSRGDQPTPFGKTPGAAPAFVA